MSIDPNTGIKVGLALWDQRNRFSDALKRLRRRLAQGKMTVLVFGAGGVGKTTLGSMLSEDFDAQAKPTAYTESLEPETYWLKANDARSILVAPGQEARVGRYWPEMYTRLTQTKQGVVINVVAYGYHAVSGEARLSTGTEAAGAFLSSRRDRELDLFAETAGFLEKLTLPLKLITLVTKEDLWWADRERVRQHYEQGEYSTLVERIRTSKGEQHFVHEYVYGCLQMQNLMLGDGTPLALTTAGYDDSARYEGQKRIMDVVERFVK
jgi:hypothetical protein